MNKHRKNEPEGIWLERLSFQSILKDLGTTVQQLQTARDNSYHRARAEAKVEAYEHIIRIAFRELISVLADHE